MSTVWLERAGGREVRGGLLPGGRYDMLNGNCAAERECGYGYVTYKSCGRKASTRSLRGSLKQMTRELRKERLIASLSVCPIELREASRILVPCAPSLNHGGDARMEDQGMKRAGVGTSFYRNNYFAAVASVVLPQVLTGLKRGGKAACGCAALRTSFKFMQILT